MLQARVSGESIATIWREAMLESRDAAAALGARPDNRERRCVSIDRGQWLLGLPSGRGYLYPAFQFDVGRRNVFEEVRHMNEMLRAADDPWGVVVGFVQRPLKRTAYGPHRHTSSRRPLLQPRKQ